jgi:hypothetical protein
MKPASPVYRSGKMGQQSEVIYAKDQPQYLALPAVKDGDGTVTTRWHMGFVERLRVLLTGDIYLRVMTFNKPLQPVKLMSRFPEA